MDLSAAIAALLVVLAADLALASVISKSSKTECVAESDVKNPNNTVCTSKLVLALTITANEVCIIKNPKLFTV